MVPLVDMHVHLLAGLDDGPRSLDDAVQMCRLSHAQGVRLRSLWLIKTKLGRTSIRTGFRLAARELADRIRQERLEFAVFPTAEVMVGPETEADWKAGKLVSVADGGKYLLLELPHNLYLDVRSLVSALAQGGVRPILAHPERTPELLYDPGRVEGLISLGALVQVSTGSVTSPTEREPSGPFAIGFGVGSSI